MKIGDRVRVINPIAPFAEQTGEVVGVYGDEIDVRFGHEGTVDHFTTFPYDVSELVTVN